MPVLRLRMHTYLPSRHSVDVMQIKQKHWLTCEQFKADNLLCLLSDQDVLCVCVCVCMCVCVCVCVCVFSFKAD